jgi:D-glycero-alpha-D-manno-heptose-7-phosphate kinase
MILSKTPLRMSFVGGGSDMEAYYKRNEGAVISTSIDKYMYITVSKKFSGDIRLSYSKTEQVDNVNEISHPLVRESLSFLKINAGVEITSTADIPSQGSGLGSSSSYTVGLLNALHTLQKKTISKMDLAEIACHIEIERCKEPIGKQDQYAAAVGGLNFIKFKNDGAVIVENIECSDSTRNTFEESILIFYTGRTRKASHLLAKQRDNLEDKSKRLMMDNMVRMAYQMKNYLEKDNVDSIGNLLHENWLLKKEITKGISNSQIDEWYMRAIKAGASGGKLLGAGNGGFLMFMADPNDHMNIIKSLSDLRNIQFSFDQSGSTIVYNDHNE